MPSARSRFTIERLRTVVLIGGVLLIAAIGIFLAAGQWKRRFLSKDLPKRLGINIQQQADGFDYTQTSKKKTLFKLHAAHVVQMSKGGKTLLHDVRIDLYGEDGARTDTIAGNEFEYDATAGLARAAGAVEITLMRPKAKRAIANLKPAASNPQPIADPGKAKPASLPDPEVHVKTSGLLFNQKTGTATTAERVDFKLQQGSGSSTGAYYDPQQGQLILDHDVELHVERNKSASGGSVTVHAQHAEFERTEQVCKLSQAHADYSGGAAQTANALFHFRDDGSVSQLDGSGGVDLLTKTGSHVTAPRATIQFDDNSHPKTAVLEGGTKLQSTQPTRQIQGSAPTAHLLFDGEGELKQAHLESGVEFQSQQQVTTPKGATAQLHRTWHSQVADITFVKSAHPNAKPQAARSESHASATGSVEPKTIHGSGNVVVTSETISTTNGQSAIEPARLQADKVDAELAPGAVLTSLTGSGHTAFEQRNAQGAHQVSTADELAVTFVPNPPKSSSNPPKSSPKANATSEIASIVQTGHVVLIQDPPPHPTTAAHASSSSSTAAPQSPIRATSAHSDYDGQKQILHLTGSPRVVNGALDLSATQIDFSKATGDAFAHGNVKAIWIQPAASASSTHSASSAFPGATLLGGSPNQSSPIHAIASEMEVHQASDEVILRTTADAANLPRLWQGANSIAAPLIILNRQKQTLTAQTTNASMPVRTTLVSAPPKPRSPASIGTTRPPKNKPDGPSVIRVASGDLHYSEAERIAFFKGGVLGKVTTETSGSNGPATVTSLEAQAKLQPAGTHNPAPSSNSAPSSGIDQITASGQVNINWPDRHGTGEKLVYLSEEETFTLTGSSSAQPRITDEARGTVTGNSLIFHTRDDSVTVEGDGARTSTETHAPGKSSKN